MDTESFYFNPIAPYDRFSSAKVYMSARDNRRMIMLYGNSQKSMVTTYARYLFQVDLWNRTGEMIPVGLEVDHINEDKLDDRLDNLQLLTKIENIIKNNYNSGSLKCVVCCPVCGDLFTIEKYRWDSKELFTCNKKCWLNFFASSPSEELKTYISDRQTKYVVKIYKSFPEGYEYLCEIKEEFKLCFYPNTLKNAEDWVPHLLMCNFTLSSLDERKRKVGKLNDLGMSERKIAEVLRLSRHQVQRSLGRDYRSKSKIKDSILRS